MMLRIAIIAGNYARVAQSTQKGTEFLVYSYLSQLHRQLGNTSDIGITVFASGNSNVPFPIVSIEEHAVTEIPDLAPYDQARMGRELLVKAVDMRDQFDLYHIHISNGQDILPLAQAINKPIIVTMYGGFANEKDRLYFSQYQHVSNVWFVPVVPRQKDSLPFLRYTNTIAHSLNLTKYPFNPKGGEEMLWAGRAIAEKGADVVIDIAERTGKPIRMFPIINNESRPWFEQEIAKKQALFTSGMTLNIRPNVDRYDLSQYFQTSKLTLMPISWEEPFGLVVAESLATGTPVVAYARGSLPDLISDGKTGFLVNASQSDHRGNWTIKKTGLDGMIEAVEKIYTMNDDVYHTIRRECRAYATTHFDIVQNVQKYIQLYKSIANFKLTVS